MNDDINPAWLQAPMAALVAMFVVLMLAGLIARIVT